MDLAGVRWIDFTDNVDDRGRLTAIEGEITVPFAIRRVFYVHQVTPGVDRAGHAHRETDQVVVSVHGSLKIDVSDGTAVKTYVLDNPAGGLFAPRMIWIRLYEFSLDAVCLVLANTQYDRSQSIRRWRDYLEVQGLPWMAEPHGGVIDGRATEARHG